VPNCLEINMRCNSPCNGICQLDRDNRCLGCLRTGDEIAAWPAMAECEKNLVLTAVRQRHELITCSNRYEFVTAA
jgi:predicted Fe-S protein YdhL (DUF1289 family)